MNSTTKTTISVETTVDAPIEKVWKFWTLPEHIIKWNNASDDWHTPRAENDLKPGGKFLSRMEAKDGSAGFDFNGIYDKVIKDELISYTIEDGRKVEILFETVKNGVRITETFEAEDENPVDMQQGGWQSILNSFKAYVEANKHLTLGGYIDDNENR